MAGMTRDVLTLHIVIPAKAEVHFDLDGMQMDPGFCRDDGIVELITP